MGNPFRSTRIHLIVFAICTLSFDTGHSQTLVGNVFSSSFEGWTDVNGTKSLGAEANWGVLLTGDKPLIESSDGRVAESATNEIGMYQPLILVNNNLTLSGNYEIKASLGTVDNDGLGIVFGYVDENNYFRYGMRSQDNGNLGFPFGNSLQKVVNGQITHLYGDQTKDHEADGVPIDVTIKVEGQTITLTTKGYVHGAIVDSDLQPGKYGVHSWYGRQFDGTSREYGSMFHKIEITGSTNHTTDFDDAVVAEWRPLEMLNQLGQSGSVNSMGNTVGEFFGNFRQDFRNGTIVDDTNGHAFGTMIGDNSRIDFTGPSVVINEPGNAGWNNYVMATRLMSHDNDGMGVLLRVAGDNNSFYRVNFQGSGAGAEDSGRPAIGMSMQKYQNGNWTEIYSENESPQFVYTPGVAFDVSVIAEGNTFKIGVVNDPDGAATAINYDPIVDANSPLLTGSVGLTSWGQGDVPNRGAEFSAYGGGGTPLLSATLPQLDLTINRATGAVTLQNNGAALSIDYYELTSAGNSLNPGVGTGNNQWTPLDLAESDPAGQGWDPAGSPSSSMLAEARFASGVTIGAGASLSLGEAYNGVVNAEDVRFRYRLDNGMFVLGDVSYIGVAPEGLAGDFNLDGTVDAADYVLWRNNLGEPEGVLNGNGNNSGVVDTDDYLLWKDNYGKSSPAALASAQAVPEPGTWALLSVAAIAFFSVRLRRIAGARRNCVEGPIPMKNAMFAAVALATMATLLSAPAHAVLVARYEFENGTNDSSGNGHHGVLIGTTSIVNDPVRGMVLSVPETGNQGMNIDTVVAIPNFAANSSITLAAWYKRESTTSLGQNFRYVIDLGQNGNQPIASLGIHSSDTIVSYIESDEPTNNGDQVNSFGNTVIEGGADTWANWHHIAVVYDRSTDLASIYLDGVLDGTNSIADLRDDFAFSWPYANIGRGPEGATSTAPGLIDDAQIYNQALTAAQIQDVMNGLPELRATVNRATGALEVENVGPAPTSIRGYAITSSDGALDPSGWTNVTNNWDSGGPGSIDTNPWAVDSATAVLLEESESPFVNGATLAPGQSFTLGNVWLQSPYENMALQFTLASGLEVSAPVEFEGGIGGVPYSRSDLNFDGNITLADWQIFLSGLGADFPSMTAAQSYRLGDLNGNGISDGGDFATFKNDFDAANGAGAFAAAIGGQAQVPEPATLAFALLVGTATLLLRRRMV